MAEEMGTAVHQGSDCIRDVSFRLNYQNPHKLPQKANGNKLCAEPHNFSRVFSGAWYEILVKIYEKEKDKMGEVKAVKHARDVAYSRLLKAVKMAPNTIKFFDAAAKCMVAAEKMKDGKYAEIMESVFLNRKIMRPNIKVLSSKKYSDILKELEKTDAVSKKGDTIVVRKMRSKKFRISNHLVTDLSSFNPLFNTELEVPGDSYYLFDGTHLVDELHPEDDEILESSMLCALSIKNYHGLGDNSMWRIAEDKLVRNHIICDFQTT